MFPSTTPTLDADVAEMARSRRTSAPRSCAFGPHASTVPVESMARAPEVDAMIVGEPEDADGGAGVAATSLTDLRRRLPASPGGGRDGDDRPAHGQGTFAGFQTMPFPAWDLLPLGNYRLPLGEQAVRHRRDEPRLPVLVRLLRRADPSGPQVPRARPEGARRRDRAGEARARRPLLLPLGRHRHAQPKTFSALLRGTDRAEPRRSSGSAMPAPTT